MKNDMMACADIIEHCIYISLKPNLELVDLLFLLRNFKRRYYPLIRCHICHYPEVTLSAIYSRMYDYLSTLMIEDKAKYDVVVLQLPYGSDWVSRIVNNIHLLIVLWFKPVPPNTVKKLETKTRLFLSTSARYKETVEALLDFR